MPTEEERSGAEANRLYWKTDAAVSDIADRLGISRRAVYRVLRPDPAGVACPYCGAAMVFTNRSARSAGELLCPGCAAQSDIGPLREVTAEAGATLRSQTMEAAPMPEPAIEQEWRAGGYTPLDTEGALLRSRALFIGGAALAGVVVGAMAVWTVSRRS